MLVDHLRLMVLTDASLLKGRDVVDACRRAVAGGATCIQVRWKPAPAREVADVARTLVGALSVPVLVNDRIDVALAVRAAGVHLGQDDVPAGALAEYLPRGFIVGLSVGSPAEAAGADHRADYWSVGPCYATPSKTDAGPPLGPVGFGTLARLAPSGVPVIGIGGITKDNAAAIRSAGGAGVAVIASVLGSNEPERAARELRLSVA
ncbi:MAG TPA: thiamine phosphate synthase [Gemmatimonadales bacterium]|nr:thiamine phosphate synthase [Gemmatimonadales bacterium]